MITLHAHTSAETELLDITPMVQRAVEGTGVREGVCLFFVPHTTAALTFNENWDPDVRRDILLSIQDIAPADSRHRHSEGNSPAHIKSSLLGVSAFVFISDGKLQLGNWQGIYLAEFDGPRTRHLWIAVLPVG